MLPQQIRSMGLSANRKQRSKCAAARPGDHRDLDFRFKRAFEHRFGGTQQTKPIMTGKVNRRRLGQNRAHDPDCSDQQRENVNRRQAISMLNARLGNPEALRCNGSLSSADAPGAVKNPVDGVGDAVVIVMAGGVISQRCNFGAGVFHGDGHARMTHEINVIEPIADGGDALRTDAPLTAVGLDHRPLVDVGGEDLQQVRLGTHCMRFSDG